jgi:hypothetical protein
MMRRVIWWIFATTALLLSSTTFAQDVLVGGQQLVTGQFLYSANKAYYAAMQTDGNFVVYRTGGVATWSTNTTGSGAVRAVMQSDGNFVLYNANNGVVWSSNTSGNPNSYFFVDGSWGGIWIYSIGPAWASHTSDGLNPPNKAPTVLTEGQELLMGQDYYQADGKYAFRFQIDGNLVLYQNGKVIWTSNTSGQGAIKAVIISGGLQLYNSAGKLVWLTNFGQNNPYSVGPLNYFAFQADGNLVAYGSKQVWGAGPPGRDNNGNCYGPPENCHAPMIPITIPLN